MKSIFKINLAYFSRILLITLLATFITNLNNIALADEKIQVHHEIVQKSLAKLEDSFRGKIGLYAINTANNEIIAYNANKRFPFQSTLKLVVVGTLLKQGMANPNLLKENIHYNKSDLIFWHPITGKYLASGMTLEALAKATMIYSDNPAANLIIKNLGGPISIDKFAHLIGNKSFNLKHYEGSLNSNPNITDDTSTPKDMAQSLQEITLSNVLSNTEKTKLIGWMKDNTTGNNRIRAGVPSGFIVADKTGSGDYGIANDIAIIWPPSGKPIVLAIFTYQNKPTAKRREDILASATKIVIEHFLNNIN